MAAADVSRVLWASCGFLCLLPVCYFANILLITEMEMWREGAGEAVGGAMFEKVPGANPVHLSFGRIPVQSH